MDGNTLRVHLHPFTPCSRHKLLYLVLESFISLGRVPIGIYLAVRWFNYIPHI